MDILKFKRDQYDANNNNNQVTTNLTKKIELATCEPGYSGDRLLNVLQPQLHVPSFHLDRE